MLRRRPIQFVDVITLDPTSDPRALITRKLEEVPLNGCLRVVTNGVKAIPPGIPFPTALDTSWWRPDVYLQFIGDPDTHQSWRNAEAIIKAEY